MNKENTERLIKTFPNLYAGSTLPPTLNLMCFGFECGDGWFDLIWELSEKLEKEIVKVRKENSSFFLTIKRWMRWFWKYKLGFRSAFLKKFDPLTWKEYNVDLIPMAVQVKEKYGTLRFYMSCENDIMSKAIEEAEEKSAETCEVCGAPGELRGYSWVYTSCDNCNKGKK